MNNGSVWFDWGRQTGALGQVGHLVSLLKYEAILPTRPGISDTDLRNAFISAVGTSPCLAPYRNGQIWDVDGGGQFPPVVLNIVNTVDQMVAARCIADLIADFSSWPNAIYSVPDADGDGWGPACDCCPNDANGNCSDDDADGIPECEDNCPGQSNPDQADGDADGIGDVCECDTVLLRHPTCIVNVDPQDPSWASLVTPGTVLPHEEYDGMLMGTTQCVNNLSPERYELSCRDATTFAGYVERKYGEYVRQSGFDGPPEAKTYLAVDVTYEDGESDEPLPSAKRLDRPIDQEPDGQWDSAEFEQAEQTPGPRTKKKPKATVKPRRRNARQRGIDFEDWGIQHLKAACFEENVESQVIYYPPDWTGRFFVRNSNGGTVRVPDSFEEGTGGAVIRDFAKVFSFDADGGGAPNRLAVEVTPPSYRYRIADALVNNCGLRSGQVSILLQTDRRTGRRSHRPLSGGVFYEFKCLNPHVAFDGNKFWSIAMMVGFYSQFRDYEEYGKLSRRNAMRPGGASVINTAYVFCSGEPPWARAVVRETFLGSVLESDDVVRIAPDAFCLDQGNSSPNIQAACLAAFREWYGNSVWIREVLVDLSLAARILLEYHSNLNGDAQLDALEQEPLYRDNLPDGLIGHLQLDRFELGKHFPFNIPLRWVLMSQFYDILTGSE